MLPYARPGKIAKNSNLYYNGCAMDEKSHWLKRLLGLNGHDDDIGRPEPQGFGALEKAIVTALVWLAAVILMLRFRNPELGLFLGAASVAATIAIWKRRV